ncbi:MAG: DUF58 domain-containing protein [Proteobacteria bacterium]|nr:DUF58 domain-containing protein [Pseudomonadota bacterium]
MQPASPQPARGLRPILSELIALRDRVRGWPPVTRSSSGIAGSAPSSLRGRGMEYAESRPYAHGDDARHIDWRLTARSGKPHTKLFQSERERTALLIVDTAPVLYFGTRVRFKSVQAARAGAIAAWAAQRRGDRVGALRGTTAQAPIPPQGGARGVLRVLDALVRWYTQPPADDAGLAHALDAAARLLHPGASAIVLADAGSLAAVDDGRLAALAARHDVLVVLLTDPLETTPPRERLPFALGDARIELDLDAAVTRARWQRAFRGELEVQTQRLRGMGARTCILVTDTADDSLLAALVDHRRAAA